MVIIYRSKNCWFVLSTWLEVKKNPDKNLLKFIIYGQVSFSLVFLDHMLSSCSFWGCSLMEPMGRVATGKHYSPQFQLSPTLSHPSPEIRQENEEACRWFWLSAVQVTPVFQFFQIEFTDTVEQRQAVNWHYVCVNSEMFTHRFHEHNKVTMVLYTEF